MSRIHQRHHDARRGGFEFVCALRADGDASAIPTLFLTARGGNSDEINALDTGGDQYLAKPFDSEVLLSRLQAMLAARARCAGSAPIPALKRSPRPLQQRIQGTCWRAWHSRMSASRSLPER